MSSTGTNIARGSAATYEHAADVAEDTAAGACRACLPELGKSKGSGEDSRFMPICRCNRVAKSNGWVGWGGRTVQVRFGSLDWRC